MWLSLFLPLVGKLLAWRPLYHFALLSCLSTMSFHHTPKMVLFVKCREELLLLGQDLTGHLVWDSWEALAR